MISIKRRIFDLLDYQNEDDLESRVLNLIILGVIFFNIVVVILESIPALSEYEPYFGAFEIFSIIFFTIEYLLRLWTCTFIDRFRHPILGRIRYVFTPLAIIDLLAFLPFYLPFLVDLDLRFIRALRLFRLFRVFKMARYSHSIKTFTNVLLAKKEELIISVLVLFTVLILASTLVYYAEKDSQPKIFTSIPDALWWATITLTTVGYGDIYPITPLGKLFGAIIAVLGIGIFALPAGIIASGFVEEIQTRRKKLNICPHCGKDMNAPPREISVKLRQ